MLRAADKARRPSAGSSSPRSAFSGAEGPFSLRQAESLRAAASKERPGAELAAARSGLIDGEEASSLRPPISSAAAWEGMLFNYRQQLHGRLISITPSFVRLHAVIWLLDASEELDDTLKNTLLKVADGQTLWRDRLEWTLKIFHYYFAITFYTYDYYLKNEMKDASSLMKKITTNFFQVFCECSRRFLFDEKCKYFALEYKESVQVCIDYFLESFGGLVLELRPARSFVSNSTVLNKFIIKLRSLVVPLLSCSRVGQSSNFQPKSQLKDGFMITKPVFAQSVTAFAHLEGPSEIVYTRVLRMLAQDQFNKRVYYTVPHAQGPDPRTNIRNAAHVCFDGVSHLRREFSFIRCAGVLPGAVTEKYNNLFKSKPGVNLCLADAPFFESWAEFSLRRRVASNLPRNVFFQQGRLGYADDDDPFSIHPKYRMRRYRKLGISDSHGLIKQLYAIRDRCKSDFTQSNRKKFRNKFNDYLAQRPLDNADWFHLFMLSNSFYILTKKIIIDNFTKAGQKLATLLLIPYPNYVAYSLALLASKKTWLVHCKSGKDRTQQFVWVMQRVVECLHLKTSQPLSRSFLVSHVQLSGIMPLANRQTLLRSSRIARLIKSEMHTDIRSSVWPVESQVAPHRGS